MTATNPIIKKNPFSERALPRNILDLPRDIYPNPLLSLGKTELSNLSELEIQHLLSIPGGSAAELEELFLNVVQIINDSIISNTSKAAFFLKAFQGSDLDLPISACLLENYKKNLLRRSIIAFLDDPTSKQARQDIAHVLKEMAEKLTIDKEESAGMILNYLQKLAALRGVNSRPIFIPEQILDLIVNYLSPIDKRTLYSYMVQANLKFANKEHFHLLKTSLLNGGPLSKLVARTGLMNIKWHDVAKFEYDAIQKDKMINFFSFSELKYFVELALKEKNILDSNLYLELLVTKFERLDDISHLQDVLQLMLVHSMLLKGPQGCIQFLRYNSELGLSTSMDTIIKVLEKLREENFFEEALFLINYLHNEKLNVKQRLKFVSEIMHVIIKKFEAHPQIVAGYFAALFNDEKKSALYLLKDLKLLGPVFEDNNEQVSIDAVKEADIHEDLKMSQLEHTTLYNMYYVILRNLDLKQSTSPLFIKLLYEAYITQVKTATANDDYGSAFHESNIKENIVTLFAEYLLRSNPHDRNSMSLSGLRLNYETAKFMIDDFVGTFNLNRSQKSIYLADLLIYSSLMQFHDISYALKILKLARSADLPVTFNQIYPFIVFHLQRKENDKALQWYQILVENGVKARSKAADDLFKVVKELNWPVKGTQYRSASRHQNRKKKSLSSSFEDDFASCKEASPSHQLFDFVKELASALEVSNKHNST